MTMKLIVARRYPRKVVLGVHLDTTRMDPAKPAEPDPAWVLTKTYEFGKGELRRQGETLAAYAARMAPWITSIKADMKDDCTARLAELTDAEDPGIALAGEGATF